MELVRVATVESPLTDRASAPKQGDEGAPEALLAFEVVWAAAGTPDAVFPIAPAKLAEAAGAVIIAVG